MAAFYGETDRYDAMIDLLRENLDEHRKTNELLKQILTALNQRDS